MTRPHVIVLMADQLRYDFIGEHTPNINGLLAESAVFDRAYCTNPLSVPARGSFFTGRYPNSTGCLINPWDPKDSSHGRVAAGTPNLYGLMDSDWDSWHTGKQHLLTEDKFDQSPDSNTHWRPLGKKYHDLLKANGKRAPGGPDYRGLMPEMAGGRVTRARNYSIPTTGCYPHELDYFFDGHIANESLAAIEGRDTSKPFLLNAMFLAPHPPLEIPEPYFSMVKEMELPENVGVWSPDQSPLQLYNLTGALGTRYTRDDWKKIWPVYAGLVALLDDCIGRILGKLKDDGLYDDALIVFTSDHGEMLGSHCLWQKMCMYEESVRAPLAFKLPGGKAFRSDALVSHVDFLPTVCDLAGVDAPPDLPGESLAGAIESGEAQGRELAFVQFDGNGALGNFQRCVVKGARKLIVDLFKDEIYFELYDLENDPQEMTNLAFDDAGGVRELGQDLIDHMAATGDRLSFSLGDHERFISDYGPYRQAT